MNNIIEFKPRIVLLIFIACFISCVNDKVADKVDFAEKCKRLVLRESKIGQDYHFNVLSKQEVLEYHITYLGEIQCKNIGKIKFLNFIVYFGLYEESKRANGAVLLYDASDKFLGMYRVGSANSVASKIESFSLIFSYNNESCDQKTVISFLDSIPKNIFIKCTKEGGGFIQLY